jgi:uncharacterized protein YxjI
MLKAKKENKIYQIDETQKLRYMNDGFDIYNEDGVIIDHSPLKKIKYSDHLKIIAEKETYIMQLETAHTELMAAYEKVAGDGLSDMTVEELKAYAETNRIELGQATSQDGILKKIRAAQKV